MRLTIVFASVLASIVSGCAPAQVDRCAVVAAATAEISTWPGGWAPYGPGSDPRLRDAEWTPVDARCGDASVEFELGRTSVTRVALVGDNLAGVQIIHEQYEVEQPGRVWECVYQCESGQWCKTGCAGTIYI